MDQKTARLLLVAALAALATYMLWAFLPSLAWACVFAVALRPVYKRFEPRFGKTFHGILLPLVATFGVAAVFLGPLALLGVEFSREARVLFAWLQQAREHGVEAPSFLSSIPMVGAALSAWWAENLAEPGAAAVLVGHYGATGVDFGRHAGAEVAHRLTQFVFTLVTLFFLFKDGDALVQQAHAAASRAFGSHGERIINMVAASISGTVNGLVLVGIGEGVLLGIVYIVSEVPHAVIFGSVTAVAAMIPFAAPVVFGLAALLLFAAGSVAKGIAVLVAGVAVTFVADHFIRPGIIGGSTNLPFLWVLLGILGGVEAFGLLGLFVGPALMAVVVMSWREWLISSTEAAVEINHSP